MALAHDFCDETGMSDSTHTALENALTSALALYQETMGEAFDVTPKLDVIDKAEFGAVAEMDGDGLFIRVSTGTVDAIRQLWSNTLADKDVQNSAFDPIIATADELSHISLVWLMLHEMHHQQMGHFQILGRASLTESFGSHSMAVARRASAPSPVLAKLEKDDVPKVEPCLEMQADHDALEMVLNAYSPDQWPELRARTAAVSAMMMLIELEDANFDQEHSSHPKAATRIFQLLGHLIQMPSIQAMLAEQRPDIGIEPHIPSEEENKAYTSQVVVPAFFDAVNLARVAETNIIREDLGEPEDFFQDVEIALMANPTAFDQLVTEGANQWADLMVLNSKLSVILDLGS